MGEKPPRHPNLTELAHSHNETHAYQSLFQGLYCLGIILFLDATNYNSILVLAETSSTMYFFADSFKYRQGKIDGYNHIQDYIHAQFLDPYSSKESFKKHITKEFALAAAMALVMVSLIWVAHSREVQRIYEIAFPVFLSVLITVLYRSLFSGPLAYYFAHRGINFDSNSEQVDQDNDFPAEVADVLTLDFEIYCKLLNKHTTHRVEYEESRNKIAIIILKYIGVFDESQHILKNRISRLEKNYAERITDYRLYVLALYIAFAIQGLVIFGLDHTFFKNFVLITASGLHIASPYIMDAMQKDIGTYQERVWTEKGFNLSQDLGILSIQLFVNTILLADPHFYSIAQGSVALQVLSVCLLEILIDRLFIQKVAMHTSLKREVQLLKQSIIEEMGDDGVEIFQKYAHRELQKHRYGQWQQALISDIVFLIKHKATIRKIMLWLDS